MRNHSFMLVGAAALTLAAGSACQREAAQTEAARTTTEQGTNTAPPAADAAQRDTALVRVMNALPGSSMSDLYADDQKVFSNLEYKTVTPYKELQDNEVTFSLLPAGSQTAQGGEQEKEILMDGRHYTVVAMPGEEKGTDLKVLADELTPPDAGMAKVRVVHAAPGVEEVEVMVPGRTDPVITDVGRTQVAGYKEIEPVSGKLILRDDANKATVAEVPASLQAGKLYTVFVLGKTGAGGKTEALMVQDELVPAAGSMGTAPATSASPKY